jgi:hypothetical protein
MAMMDDTYERLMQDELEGTARPEDSARLRAHLAADAGARARFEELRLVFQVLGQVEMAEAPAGIREHVLRAIATDPVRRAGWLSDLRAAFARRPALTFTYSFAGGALAATIVFALVTGRVMLPGPGEAPVTGTMAPVAGRESLLDRGVLEVAGARVDVRWRRLPDGFLALPGLVRENGTSRGTGGARPRPDRHRGLGRSRLRAAFQRGALDGLVAAGDAQRRA